MHLWCTGALSQGDSNPLHQDPPKHKRGWALQKCMDPTSLCAWGVTIEDCGAKDMAPSIHAGPTSMKGEHTTGVEDAILAHPLGQGSGLGLGMEICFPDVLE